MEQTQETAPRQPSRWYAHYVLGVLTLVYFFNFVDRNILSILAESIKADLGVTDAQMGFLYGTVFAVFYAVFGIPLARFADVWVRRSVISVGLLFWSAMTAASGLARSFVELAVYRTGVGIGEASASPAAYSLLYDYYAPRYRATVVAIYTSGVAIGIGAGLFLGGTILDFWGELYPENPPFGLKGWQVAFMAVGLPGIAMAAWVRTLREPVRGISEGLVTKPHPRPFHVLGTELVSVIPPLNVIGLVRDGASLRLNALLALAIVGGAAGLIWLTGDWAQWIAMGIGVYATVSWVQSLARRDPATFAMIFKSRAMIYAMLSAPIGGFVGYGVAFWTAPLLMRAHDTSAAEVGLWIGIGAAASGIIGVAGGGFLADRLRIRFPTGRLMLGYAAVAGTAPLRPADDLHGEPGHRVPGELPGERAERFLGGDRPEHVERPRHAAHARDRGRLLHPAHDLHRPGARPVRDRQAVGCLHRGRHERRRRAAPRDGDLPAGLHRVGVLPRDGPAPPAAGRGDASGAGAGVGGGGG